MLVVDLDNSDYNEFPGEIFVNDEWKEGEEFQLSLCGNNVSRLPENLLSNGELQFCCEIKLDENNLANVPSTLFALPNLRVLSLVGNNLDNLPECEEIISSKLLKINLNENNLSFLPETFCKLNSLEQCEIASNNLSFLPNSFGELIKLRTLDLSDNEIRYLPESFADIPNIEVLDFSKNKLSELPKLFNSSSTLVRLYLDENNLSFTPDWFGELEKLEEISVIGNDFIGTPFGAKFCENCIKLARMNASGNYIESLPEAVCHLKMLQWLHLGSTLAELERHTFSNGNNLTVLPYAFGQLSRLTYLRIDENHLVCLPESFGDLESLQYLDLSQNMLRHLPGSFCDLVDLKTCLLSKNALVDLPEQFGQLQRLQELRLDNNQLSKLPDSFDELLPLEFLDLFHNRLVEIPILLFALTNLVKLDIDENLFSVDFDVIPKMYVKNCYAVLKNDAKGWRGKRSSTFKMTEALDIACDSKEIAVVDKAPAEVPYNSCALQNAIRQNMNYWQSHGNNGPRKKFVRAAAKDTDRSVSTFQPVESSQFEDDAIHKAEESGPVDQLEEDWSDKSYDNLKSIDSEVLHHFFLPGSTHKLAHCPRLCSSDTIVEGQFDDYEDAA